MLEKEIDREQEKILLVQHLSDLYPQMSLERPLVDTDFDILIPGMNSYEFKFASYFHHEGYSIFREPDIFGCSHLPDFFMYNPIVNDGKLVELTMYNRDFTNCNVSRRPRNEVKKTILRKKGQIEELESCNIPFVVLYREDLEQLRREYIPDLF